MKTKRIVSLVLALLMMCGTVAMTAAAEPEDAAEATAGEACIVREVVVPEDEVAFNTEIMAEDVFENEIENNQITEDANITVQSEESAATAQSVNAQADGNTSFFQKIINFIKKLLGIKEYFIIHYNANGGTGSMGTQKIEYGVATPLYENTFTRSGYAFSHWTCQRDKDQLWKRKDKDGKEKFTSDTGLPKVEYGDKCKLAKTAEPGESITFYANWKPAIDSESRLKEAAAQGGAWELTKDITVSSYILVSKDLTINGNGHKITRENGAIDGPAENIFVVDHKVKLTLNNTTLNAVNCQCIRVRTSADLVIDHRCILTSKGDGIENYGTVQVSGDSSITAEGSGSAAIWNRITGQESEIGTVVLYWCNISYILNDGKLYLEQNNSVVTRVRNSAGAKSFMKDGHIGTYVFYFDSDLTKNGGKIDELKRIEINSTPGKLAGALIETAKREIGYLEKKSNADLNDKTKNAGSGNYTKYGAWYGNNGTFWCAMFVAWCVKEAGISYTNKYEKSMPAGGMYINSYCPTIVDYAVKEKKWVSKGNPKVGDLVFLDWQPNGYADHIAIVYAIEGNKILTIEGNRDNAVGTASYSITENTVLGYYRWA